MSIPSNTTVSTPAPAPAPAALHPSPAPASAPAPAPAAAPAPADSASPAAGTPATATPATATAAGEAPASVGMTDESSVTWNGELDALTSAEWFNTGVDEKYRNVLLEGMKTKYKHLEGGFTKKTQEIAAERKGWQDKEQQLSNELRQYRLWLDTGKDPDAQVREEAESLRQQLTAATAAREQLEKDLRAQVEAEFNEKLTPLEQERLELQERLAAQEATATAQEEARNQEIREGLVKWISTTAPGLWDDENENALATFTHFLETGAANDPQTALKLVGALYPKFNPLAAEPVPAAIDVMNNDSTAAFADASPKNGRVSYNDIKKQLYDQAMK